MNPLVFTPPPVCTPLNGLGAKRPKKGEHGVLTPRGPAMPDKFVRRRDCEGEAINHDGQSQYLQSVSVIFNVQCLLLAFLQELLHFP